SQSSRSSHETVGPDAPPREVLRPSLPDVDLDATEGDMGMAAHQHAANHFLSSLAKPLLGMPGHVRRHLDRSTTPVQGDRSPNFTPFRFYTPPRGEGNLGQALHALPEGVLPVPASFVFLLASFRERRSQQFPSSRSTADWRDTIMVIV